jgi:hypothetical protein
MRTARWPLCLCVLTQLACDDIMQAQAPAAELVAFAELTFDGVGGLDMSAALTTVPSLNASFPLDADSASVTGALDVNGNGAQRLRYVFASFDESALGALSSSSGRRRAVVTIGAAGITMGGTAVTALSDGAGGTPDHSTAADIRPAAMPAFDTDGRVVFRTGSLRSATGAEITALQRQAGAVHIFAPAFLADGVVSFAFAMPLATDARANVANFSVLLLIFDHQ